MGKNCHLPVCWLKQLCSLVMNKLVEADREVDQEVDQRKLGKRLWKKTVKHVD